MNLKASVGEQYIALFISHAWTFLLEIGAPWTLPKIASTGLASDQIKWVLELDGNASFKQGI